MVLTGGCLCRAAFQYGIKMSEGRKTRRFKETNEKAELDRQWKKISAVRSNNTNTMKSTQQYKCRGTAATALLSVSDY